MEVGAGYDFGVVRAELSDLYNHATLTSLRASALGQRVSASISDGGVNTNSVMASAYVDIPPCSFAGKTATESDAALTLIASRCRTPVLPSDHYKPPSFLQDLHVLDLLELTGSQARAGRALAMHQSTVCRSLRLLQKDLRLTPANGSAVCRHGHNTCLHHLRLACRAHRLMAGVLRIGTDVLHHNLIMRCGAAQPVPPRFRRAEHWVELIRHGLLDGAILSSLALEKRLLSGQAPRWEGISARPLGMISLQLVATTADAQRVLLPAQATAPLLHQGIAAQGLGIEKQPAACQEPEAWLKRARDRGLALPIIPALVAENWLSMQGLTALREQPLLIEQLWLLSALGISNNASQRLLRQLRSLVRNSETMLNSHENRD